MGAHATELGDHDVKQLADFSELLNLLARLHDREPDKSLIEGLQRADMEEWLCSLLPSGETKSAAIGFVAAVNEISFPSETATLNVLAAEFADIYLTYSYRISPNGSVWLTEDKLERQEPMFAPLV